jgi:hypothetical protein
MVSKNYKCPYLDDMSEGIHVQNYGATIVVQTNHSSRRRECISKHMNDLGTKKILVVCPDGA